MADLVRILERHPGRANPTLERHLDTTAGARPVNMSTRRNHTGEATRSVLDGADRHHVAPRPLATGPHPGVELVVRSTSISTTLTS